MPVVAWMLQSRTACAALAIAAVLGGFFVWHKVDKSSEVRRAVVEYVADAELTAARVQLEELKRRKVVTERANRRFLSLIDQANAEAEAAAQELEHYVSTVGDGCILQPYLFERLRNQ
jgi:F0F1-type ATP synthase membrane subunit b/b'